ncbi:MAG: DUF485 domain-containing protein [Candidatus Bathyarchaeota archaeon]|jgi:uncharacterized membrane protein (DUF485 family)|nr:DUF485 domain-containing protein [Candidatus Bathyarchaeota archaeon]
MARRDAERRKFRVGLALFIIYAVGYALFTLAGTFYKGVLTARLGGLNVGVISGMLIIISAIVIAVLYNWFAGKTEE